MNILVSSNENYFYPLLVSLYSLFVNNLDERHHVYFVHGGISDACLQIMKRFVERGGRASLITRKVNESEFSEFSISHHFSRETYYRFLAQTFIPEHEDRVLWIDADMIIKKSLKDFYYQDFADNYLVVCPSINKNADELLRKLECPEGTVYFNAGILLFNLRKIREDITLDSYYQYFRKHESQITWLDQDILNGMYAKKTKVAQNRIYNYQFFNETKFQPEELKYIADNTAVLHYIGSVKPWHVGYNNPLRRYWYAYARKVLPLKMQLHLAKELLKRKLGSFRVYNLGKRIYHKIKREFRKSINNTGFYIEVLRKDAILLGTPDHNNIGDSAIVTAEIEFLRRCGKETLELTVKEYPRYRELLKRILVLKRNQIIYWHGGGNMGDQWFKEELFRREVLCELKNHRQVIFPQTIYYSNTEEGIREKEASRAVYNRKSGLVLVAREKQSYEIMKELYPDAQILLSPDIVLSSSMESFGVIPEKRSGVLMCLRNDPEKSVSDESWDCLGNYFIDMGWECRKTDMYAKGAVTKDKRRDCIREKMQEFCGAKLVVTDRLHGMVFAALTGTPCIVFGNYNHKVYGTYEWISYLPYIKYVESVEEAEQCFPELISLENCRYDGEPLTPYFEKLKKFCICYSAKKEEKCV